MNAHDLTDWEIRCLRGGLAAHLRMVRLELAATPGLSATFRRKFPKLERRRFPRPVRVPAMRCEGCGAPLEPDDDATRWEGFRDSCERYGIAGPACEECCHESIQAAAEDVAEGRDEPPDQYEAAETLRELGGF